MGRVTPAASAMVRLAFQAGRVAFVVCVVYGVLMTIGGTKYGLLLIPFGLFFWWFTFTAARLFDETFGPGNSASPPRSGR